MAGGIVLFLFGAVTTLLSFRMPLGTFRNAGTGLFPLILGILLMFLSGLFLLRLFLKTQATREKLSDGRDTYIIQTVAAFLWNDGFGHIALQPIRIPTLFISRDGGPFENPRDETVVFQYLYLFADSGGLLFSICSMAQNSSSQGVDRVMRKIQVPGFRLRV